MIISHNYEEEMQALQNLKELAEDVNSIELDKLFIGADEIAKALKCSLRRAKEFMRAPDFPSINLGGKPVVNVFALANYTMQRIDYEKIQKL